MTTAALLAVPNISEGRDEALVRHIAGTDALLDISSDPDHNRSVLTYGGEPDTVVDAIFAMIERAVASLDINGHEGAHPRFGVVDVLPFVPYGVEPDVASRAVDQIVFRLAQGPSVPTFFYGVERSLPELRRRLRDDRSAGHPTAGVICLGIRGPLIAFNVNMQGSLENAKTIAREIRSKEIRALGFELPSRGLVQVSMNLVQPFDVGPRGAFERITGNIVDCELVGLVPDGVPIEGLPWRSRPRTIAEALR